MNIHYNETTGEIVSYGHGVDCGSGFDDSHLPGCKVAIIDTQEIDARRQRFDSVAWKVVDKDEPDAPRDETLAVVKTAVSRELAATDRYMLPDFPISDADQTAWASYRKALRDSSKGNATAASMLAAISSRPDGVDAFAWMRPKVESGEPINGVIFA